MICEKPFSIVVGPGVDWQNLQWIRQTLQQGGGTAVFSPDGGISNEWSASCSNPLNSGTTVRTTYRGTLTYAGPNRAASAQMQIANNEVIAQPGLCSLSMNYFLNSVFQVGVAMPQAYNGPLALNFTAATGLIELVFDMISTQPGGTQPTPMVITCTGVVVNL